MITSIIQLSEKRKNEIVRMWIRNRKKAHDRYVARYRDKVILTPEQRLARLTARRAARLEKLRIEGKICSRCGTRKSIDDFYFEKSRHCYRSECRVCEAKWRGRNPGGVLD